MKKTVNMVTTLSGDKFNLWFFCKKITLGSLKSMRSWRNKFPEANNGRKKERKKMEERNNHMPQDRQEISILQRHKFGQKSKLPHWIKQSIVAKCWNTSNSLDSNYSQAHLALFLSFSCFEESGQTPAHSLNHKLAVFHNQHHFEMQYEGNRHP